MVELLRLLKNPRLAKLNGPSKPWLLKYLPTRKNKLCAPFTVADTNCAIRFPTFYSADDDREKIWRGWELRTNRTTQGHEPSCIEPQATAVQNKAVSCDYEIGFEQVQKVQDYCSRNRCSCVRMIMFCIKVVLFLSLYTMHMIPVFRDESLHCRFWLQVYQHGVVSVWMIVSWNEHCR